MAWVANDDFEALSDGADIAGTSGGSGWNGNWSDSGSASNKWVATTTNPGHLLVSAIFTGNGASKNRTISRDIVSINAGTVFANFKVSQANISTQIVFCMNDAVNFRSRVRFAGDGTVGIFNGATYETKFTGLSVDTWYRIGLTFDCTAQTTSCNLNGGAFSTTTAMEAAGGGDIITLKIFGNVLTSGQSVYADFVDGGFSRSFNMDETAGW